MPDQFQFYPNAKYNPQIPRLKETLGYDFGERITKYAGLEKYLHILAKSSERVKLFTYGESYEGRKLYYLLISAPQNLQRLEPTKSNLEKLADPRATSEAEAEAIIAQNPTMPVITWLGYNVHGNEHSTGESALLLAYHLSAGLDAETNFILDRSIVVIDPMQNPDGRERSVNYFYSAFGINPNPDANAAEHVEPWPGGRWNHYIFDLNRDWFLLTQKESLAKVKAFLEWKPQVYADIHEMGPNSSYYFVPPAKPVNPNFPDSTQKWWEIFGRANAEAFDQIGVVYYTQETFDAFFPGYGECWPILHGAVGMTYEQASARGLTIKRSDDTILTLKEAIWHHFTACLATCSTAARHREQLLRDFYNFNQSAIEAGNTSPFKEILIPIEPNQNAADINQLIEKLMAQGVEVEVAQSDFKVEAARDFFDQPFENQRLSKGTYIIRLNQPKKRLLQTLFEKEANIDEKFIQDELKRKAERQPSEFYDITAWSIPLAYNLKGYWNQEFSKVETSKLSFIPKSSQIKIKTEAKLGYLLNYTSNAAAKAIISLLQSGCKVRIAKKAFKLEGLVFKRGSALLNLRINPTGLKDIILKVAEENSVEFQPVDSSWSEEGIMLGSSNFIPLKPPKVAVLYDSPAYSTGYGWISYLFEQRYKLNFTSMRLNTLTSANLNEYTTIIFPDGSADEYFKRLGEEGVSKLKSWMSEGGILIAIKGAAAFASKKELKLTTSKLITDLRELEKLEKKEPQPNKTDKADKGTKSEEKADSEPIPDEHKPDEIPGAALKVKLDQNHLLTCGYEEYLTVLVDSSYIFTPSIKGRNAALFCDEKELKVSGFVWEKMQKALANQAYLVAEPIGRGHLTLFADDPSFRASWEGLHRLLLNATIFMPSL